MKTNHIKVDLPKEKIADFCRRHHIRKLADSEADRPGDPAECASESRQSNQMTGYTLPFACRSLGRIAFFA
jgi:hypothetical protein